MKSGNTFIKYPIATWAAGQPLKGPVNAHTHFFPHFPNHRLWISQRRTVRGRSVSKNNPRTDPQALFHKFSSAAK